jgi:hypothetical protein
MPAQTPQDAAVPPAARETMDAADRLTAALSAMTGQLEAVNKRLDLAEKAARRSRRIIVGLVVSLVLDVTLTILVTVFALQAHNASAQASATVADLHATQIQACQIGNQTLAKEILLWTHLAAISTNAQTTTAQRKTDAQLLAFIRQTFAPRNCARIYKLPRASG